jgi:glycine oxidase
LTLIAGVGFGTFARFNYMRILIIGQGIAGSVLGWVLTQRGAHVHYADAGLAGAASTTAAGIINPVTGKRYVKSWEFDTWYPTAQRVYQAMEADLGACFWYEQDIVRLLQGAEEANNWSARCSQPDYAQLLSEPTDAGDWEGLIRTGYEAARIHSAARVDFGALKYAVRCRAQALGAYEQRAYTPDDMLAATQAYDWVICCTGWWAKHCPLFPELPWQIAKGEAIRIKILHPDAQGIRQMLKRTHAIVPLADGTFWVGGTYAWQFEDVHPSDSEGDLLREQVHDLLSVPYEVVERLAGVRPSVRTRRPFLCASLTQSNLLMFNGLGTKGALLAPGLAELMADYLFEKATLPAW